MAKASNILLIVLIGLTIGLLVLSNYIWKLDTKVDRIEGFTSSYTVNDLEINTCPNYASEIQTSKGSTDCCQGDLVDGKCNGTTFCTKSPAYGDIPTCIDKWREYFREKGLSSCPATMPNYYEDITNSKSEKGCSVGSINKNGKIPSDSNSKKCIIYPTETENKRGINSCYNEKFRASIQCPVVNGESPSATIQEQRGNILFMCNYPVEIGMANFCYEKTSFYEYITKLFPNWQTNEAYTKFVDNAICDNFLETRDIGKRETAKLEVIPLNKEIQDLVERGFLTNYTKCVDNSKVKDIASSNKLRNDDNNLNQTRFQLCKHFYTETSYKGGDKMDTRKYEYRKISEQVKELVRRGNINNYTKCFDSSLVKFIANNNLLPDDDASASQTRFFLCKDFYTDGYVCNDTRDTRKSQYRSLFPL